jgi:hypothetical protein
MALIKQVEVVKVNTMADGTIRLTIDLLAGTGEDMATVYNFRAVDTMMQLSTVEEYEEAVSDGSDDN